ncbi:MAG: RHS repeat-associated core domain-containing protein, partial [Verrucomicrobiota bacterium]
MTDRKVAVESTTPGLVDYYQAEVVKATDYYPFGIEMPGTYNTSTMQYEGRTFNADNYRYGFNGKENDRDEWGKQLVQDYGFRLYNPAVGRFLSEDPLTSSYPMLTPYQFASNRPINGIDIDGLEWILKIYSPDISASFKKVATADVVDLLELRRLSHYALTHEFTADNGQVSDYASRSYDNIRDQGQIPNNKAAQLVYDDDAPPGVSVELHKWLGGSSDSQGIIEDLGGKPIHFAKNRPASLFGLDLPKDFGTDAGYPVDVRAFDPREDGGSNIYFGPEGETVDMVGISTGKNISIGPKSNGTVTFQGYIKGWGYVNLETTIPYESSWINVSVVRGLTFGEFQGQGIISPLSLLGDGGSVSSGIRYFQAESWMSFDENGQISWAGATIGLGISISVGTKVTASTSETKMTFPVLNDDT